MADFALWAVAAEPAFGVAPGPFLESYDRNRDRADEIALEANRIAEIIAGIVPQSGEWSGTATELLDALNGRVDDDTRRTRDWPKSPQAMGNVMRRLAPNLRSVEIAVRFERPGGKRRVITLERVGKRPSLLSQRHLSVTTMTAPPLPNLMTVCPSLPCWMKRGHRECDA